jgi:hypothetical protein
MANANTIAMAPKAAAGGGTAWATTETIVARASDSTAACLVYLPASGRLDGKKIKVNARGRMTGGTTTNVTIALYKGTSLTVGSNTKVATSAATACNSASGNWELSWEGVYDATSLALQARMQGLNNGTAIALAAATANLASVSNSTEKATAFCVSGLFPASNAGNIFQLDELSIEVL